MNELNSNSRLSRIETMWSVVRRAHDSDSVQVETAQQQLLETYGSAIRRYLLAAVRDADLADDLFQEFAVKFVNGDFRSADPEKGRFRSFVKTILSRMIALHYRKQRTRKEKPLQSEIEEGESGFDEPDDEVFLASWREELLSRTWSALKDHELRSGQKYDTVLRIKVAEPTLNSSQLAERLSHAIGKEVSPGSARVLVHRSREKFAKLLIDVVAGSLESGRREDVESELIDLGLIDYCREALDQLPSTDETNKD